MQSALFAFVMVASSVGYTTPAIAGCVTVLPLPEDVHYAIRKSRAQSLKRWIAGDRATPDVIDPESGRTPMMTAFDPPITAKTFQYFCLNRARQQLDLTDGAGNSARHVAAQINEPLASPLPCCRQEPTSRLRNNQGQTFQRNLFMTPRNSLNSDTCKGMECGCLVAEG